MMSSITRKAVRTEILATVSWLILGLLREYSVNIEKKRMFKKKNVSKRLTKRFLYTDAWMKALSRRIQLTVKMIT